MFRTLEVIKRIYEQYNGTGRHMLLFWICLLVMAACAARKKDARVCQLLFVCLGVLAVTVCPLTARIIMKYCIEEETYWRMLWMLPVPMVLAYVMTEGIWHVKIKKKWLRGMFVCVFAAVIVVAGAPVLSRSQFSKASGLEKLPEPVTEICQALDKASRQNPDEEKRVLAEDELVCYLRQYDGTLLMPYGRSVLRGLKKMKLHEVLNDPACDYARLTKLARRQGCSYLVLYTERSYDSQVPEGTCEQEAQIGKYTIYHLMRD